MYNDYGALYYFKPDAQELLKNWMFIYGTGQLERLNEFMTSSFERNTALEEVRLHLTPRFRSNTIKALFVVAKVDRRKRRSTVRCFEEH